MANDRTEPDRPRVSSDPNKPAYDNPVGNKGDLVTGDNVRDDTKDERPRPAPQGHDSDKTLGQKPPPGT